jgi:hypothetical protein
MKICRFEFVRVFGRCGLASACAIFILNAATIHSPKSRPFAFESTATGSKVLTKWPTCSTIAYSLNMSNAPKNAAAVIARDTTIAHEITGLAFRRIHESAPPNFTTYDESGSIAPVIFAWVGSDQLFGQRNVNAVTVPIVDATRTHYTSGVVLFNDDMNTDFQTHPKFANNLVLHELGHILGLSDVITPSEVMTYYLQPNTTIGTYARGDVAGLGKLYPDAHDCVQLATSKVRAAAHVIVKSRKLNTRSVPRIASAKEKQWG